MLLSAGVVEIGQTEPETSRSAGGIAPAAIAQPFGDVSAMNGGLVAGQGFDSLAYFPDGRLATLTWKIDPPMTADLSVPDENSHKYNLMLRIRDAAGNWSEEQIYTDDSNFSNTFFASDNNQAQLLIDSQGQVHILYEAQPSKIAHVMKVNGNWKEVDHAAVSDNPNFSAGISAMHAVMGPDDKIHLIAIVGQSAGFAQGRTWRIKYYTYSAGQWSVEVAAVLPDDFHFPSFPVNARYLSLAVDSAGKAHIAYTPTSTLTENDNGTVRQYSTLGYLTNASGSWQSQTIYGPPDDSGDAGTGSSIAIAPDGRPAIANFFVDRVSTGSASFSQLLYHKQQPDGGWSTEVVTSSPDNYAAGDGAKFTGFAPQLRFDSQGRPNIVFSDHATQHFPDTGADEFSGQIRWAVKSGGWNIQTVYQQPNPLLNQIYYPSFAITPYEVSFIGLRRFDTLGANFSVLRSEHFVVLGSIVTGVNPNPQLTLPAKPLSYLAGQGPLVIAAGANVTSARPDSFAGGQLVVTLKSGAVADDRLGFRSDETGTKYVLSGNTITVTPTGQPARTVGTVSGGTGTTPLTITWAGSVQFADIQAVIRQITFSMATSPTSNSNRTFTMKLTDGQGGSSSTVERNLQIFAAVAAGTPGPMYRAYNPNANYHFFTTTRSEFDNAVTNGYRDESTGQEGFKVHLQPVTGTTFIHRLYNPNTGRHYYTLNDFERDFLVNAGWTFEKEEGYLYPSSQPGTTEVFRLYNSDSGVHLYTQSPAVRDSVLAIEEVINGVKTGRHPWQLHSSLGFGFLNTGSNTGGTTVAPLAAAIGLPAVGETLSLNSATVDPFSAAGGLHAELLGTLVERLIATSAPVPAVAVQSFTPAAADLETSAASGTAFGSEATESSDAVTDEWLDAVLQNAVAGSELDPVWP